MPQTQPKPGHLHGSAKNPKKGGGAIEKDTQGKPGHLHGASPAKKRSGGSLPDADLNRGFVDNKRRDAKSKRVNDHVRKGGSPY